jgi:protein-disulfide isomerase-like protein with CxxC motif
MSSRNVIDLARYQQGRVVGKAQAFSTRLCRHCGAGLADGENEDECSSTLNLDAASILRTVQRKFYAE